MGDIREPGRRLARWVATIPVRVAIYLVRFYQVCISPLHGPCCRFTPTCSQYAILAFKKYGFFLGGLKTLWRILRCNPFGGSGYDPP